MPCLYAGSRKASKPFEHSGKGSAVVPGAILNKDSNLAETPTDGAGGAGETTAREGGVEEMTATGRRKRKDTGTVREKARSWSEAEETLFLESLELHGIAPPLKHYC